MNVLTFKRSFFYFDCHFLFLLLLLNCPFYESHAIPGSFREPQDGISSRFSSNSIAPPATLSSSSSSSASLPSSSTQASSSLSSSSPSSSSPPASIVHHAHVVLPSKPLPLLRLDPSDQQFFNSSTSSASSPSSSIEVLGEKSLPSSSSSSSSTSSTSASKSASVAVVVSQTSNPLFFRPSVTRSSCWNLSSVPAGQITAYQPICKCFFSDATHTLGDSVKVVNCSDKGLTSVFDSTIPHDAESIDLSHNQLDDLHNKIPSGVSEHLLHLDVSFNEIRQLGRGHIFMNFTHMRHLDLSGNHFKTLFAGVFRGMKRLETLVMRDGQLKYIDEHAFDGLENLRHLDLESNQIASIYLELFQSILNLHVLNLGRNSISHLSGGVFASLTGLRRLVLSFNHISGINNNAFVGLDTLEELYLDHNRLTHVPSIALQSLKRLRLFKIGGNALHQIATGDFVHTPIESLFIDNCPDLELIDRGAFWDLPGLKSLYLHSNPRLGFVDAQAFLGVPSLDSLFLQNTSIRVMQEEMISMILHRDPQSIGSSISSILGRDGERLKLALQGTPLLCDCNVRYLYQNLKNSSLIIEVMDPESLLCHDPPSLRNVRLVDLEFDPSSSSSSTPHSNTSVSADPQTTTQITEEHSSSISSSNQSSSRRISESCPPLILSGSRSRRDRSSSNSRQLHHDDHDDDGEADLIPGSASYSSDAAAAAAASIVDPDVESSDGNHVLMTVVHKRIGDRHTFQCRALGIPTPRIYWILPSGDVLNESNNSVLSHVQLLAQGSLRLFRIQARDSGNYTCVASNPLGEARHLQVLVIDIIDIHILPLGTSPGMLHEKSTASSSTAAGSPLLRGGGGGSYITSRDPSGSLLLLPQLLIIALIALSADTVF